MTESNEMQMWLTLSHGAIAVLFGLYTIAVVRVRSAHVTSRQEVTTEVR